MNAETLTSFLLFATSGHDEKSLLLESLIELTCKVISTTTVSEGTSFIISVKVFCLSRGSQLRTATAEPARCRTRQPPTGEATALRSLSVAAREPLLTPLEKAHATEQKKKVLNSGPGSESAKS